MVDWTPVAIGVGVGGGSGVADQLLQNWDEKRKRADPTIGMWREGGTYLNYGVPILSVLALAFGALREPWSTRAVLVGSQLAGRKATYKITKAAQSAPYSPAPNYRAVPPPPVPQTQKPGYEKVGII